MLETMDYVLLSQNTCVCFHARPEIIRWIRTVAVVMSIVNDYALRKFVPLHF